MTKLIFHHDPAQLQRNNGTAIQVLLYSLPTPDEKHLSSIGNPIVKKIKKLGGPISKQAIDFLSIALAVTACDTFVQRKDAEDGWTRQFEVLLPLCEPERWNPVKTEIEKALRFLSGDMWSFNFTTGGYQPPTSSKRPNPLILEKLKKTDCICLFSGGLDSAIGSIDLLGQGRSPLLVSHAYKGDKKKQNAIVSFLRGNYSQFQVNADPHFHTKGTEITMRTRSLNFLAFGVVGASALQAITGREQVDLFVPENGFISLNVPLTTRRVGSLSTKTTHPYFIATIQKIFEEVKIPCIIKNPYQMKTKGEMVFECSDKNLLEKIVDHTVSCSHWKRKNKQCGICVPCIIRRAALYSGNIPESIDYVVNDLQKVLSKSNKKDDLQAIAIALEVMKTRKPITWILDSGPLPDDLLQDYSNVFNRGLNETKLFLISKGMPC